MVIRILTLLLFFIDLVQAQEVHYVSKNGKPIPCYRSDANTIRAGKLTKNGILSFSALRNKIKKEVRTGDTSRLEAESQMRAFKKETRLCRANYKLALNTQASSLIKFDSGVFFQQLLRVVRNKGGNTYNTNLEMDSAKSGSLTPSNSGKDSGFSSTYLQVNGVDEADYVKYDGKHLFLLDNDNISNSPGGTEVTNYLRVLSTDPATANTQALQNIPISGKGLYLSGLYLSSAGEQKVLSSLGSKNPYYALATVKTDTKLVDPGYTYDEPKVFLDIRDVTQIDNIQVLSQISIDGFLKDSRRIGNFLYLITNFSSPPAVNRSESGKANDDFLPHIRVNGADMGALHTFSDCYFENTPFANVPDQVLSITAINLTDRSWSSTCALTRADQYFVSTDALYMLRTSWNSDQTYVHKFALNGPAAEYRGSGIVQGILSSVSNPQFLLGESDGVFRILTTTGQGFFRGVTPEGNPFEHRLTLLKENQNTLQEVAHLPNAARPEPIGKDNENVYAVRYTKNRAYVVTFLKTDPFYVIDLSVAEDPKIAGKLEIPGFSSLLHPINDNLVLSVGKNSLDSGSSQFAWFQGMKVELFDVSSVQQPKSIGKIDIGKRGTESDMFYDYHGFTFLEGSAGTPHRFAIPVVRHDATEVPAEDNTQMPTYFPWTDTGLHLFEIRNYEDLTKTELAKVGELLVAKKGEQADEYGAYAAYQRSVIHDNAVFYAFGPKKVFGAFWGTSALVSGPN